jgi:hypothetical protein
MRYTLAFAAEYVKTAKAPRAFFILLQSIRRIYNFGQERANRLVRYVAIVRSYKKGTPVKTIEEKFGCSRGTVLRYARSAELPKRPKHFPIEIRKAVIADYKNGVPIAKIAQLHAVSQAYVSKMATEEGISRYAK